MPRRCRRPARARLTSSLLAFARRQVMQTETLDISSLIQEFVPLIRESIGETIDVELMLAADLRPCKADAGQLEAALPERGHQRAGCDGKRREADHLHKQRPPPARRPGGQHRDRAGPFIAVALTDTGSGMAPEVAAKAFDPFFTTKDAGKGAAWGESGARLCAAAWRPRYASEQARAWQRGDPVPAAGVTAAVGRWILFLCYKIMARRLRPAPKIAALAEFGHWKDRRQRPASGEHDLRDSHPLPFHH